MKIALIQMNSQPYRAANLRQAEELMQQALSGRPDLIVLPEHFDWTGGTAVQKRAAADHVPGGAAYKLVQSFAARNRVAIHAGSLLETRVGSKRIHNTSVVFDAHGNEIGLYRKIHLFDIVAPDGKVYNESETVAAGDSLLIYEIGGIRIACCICYDLRFSRLFDRLAQENVDIFVLPAAFTRQTGKDHWEVLCRARAIEFQAYVVACGQCGHYETPAGERRDMHGHSMVCDPWGKVVAEAGDEVGVLEVEIDPTCITAVRSLIPMATHRVDLQNVQLAVRKAQR
ncbi:carbon-nitrogen hydrolase family protein [Ensifer sp. Root278]|uniref:carbon-nitrogen hydrolase family protein n=1 Tax=unclassified Ensifer TaxID=2633371 RepID=UPI00070F853C|nr:carbon-nitrogen hydrolase family protein [Ensifer sp. Root278]KRD63347.1 nitrilase [Ensifer sp. Root278]